MTGCAESFTLVLEAGAAPAVERLLARRGVSIMEPSPGEAGACAGQLLGPVPRHAANLRLAPDRMPVARSN
jgi:hypothetical protein